MLLSASFVLLVHTGAVALPTAAAPEAIEKVPMQTQSSTQNTNVLFIVLDTTRYDHMSAYGYPRKTTPVFDELAEYGVLFENSYSVVPYTTSSHISMMSSQYPFVYQPRPMRANSSGFVTIPEKYLMMAEVLKANGYNTAAVISVGMMDWDSGLSQGFDYYNFPPGVRLAAETTPFALDWLEENANNGKFFLWFHLYDPHDNYMEHDGITEQYVDYNKMYDELYPQHFTEIRKVISRYDGEIRFGDDHIGMVIDKLEELGVKDNTLIVYTSDHGEQFGEHETPFYRGMSFPVLYEHARTLYDQETHVPLVMSLPGTLPEGKKVDSFVEHVDLMPTVLDVLGIPSTEKAQGVSLLPLMQGDVNSFRQFAFTHLYPIISPYYKSAVQEECWKYIYDHYQDEPQLFNLCDDPQETINLVDEEHEQALRLEEKLIEHIENYSGSVEGATPEFDVETFQRLRALGYLQ